MANYIDENDVQTWGSDLVNFAQRAAAHAVAPALQGLANENAELNRRLAQESKHRLDQELAAAVPGFMEIDRDPRWHRWLLGIDSHTGLMRQQILDDAIQARNVTRVAAFFRGFQQEAGTAGQGQTHHSGRRSSGKPFYSRAKIAELYDDHRRGAYAGREKEWSQIENDIFAAQREGRIESVPAFLSK